MKDGNQAGILLSQPAWKEPMHGNLSALLADTLLVLLGLFGVAHLYRPVCLPVSRNLFFKTVADAHPIDLICRLLRNRLPAAHILFAGVCDLHQSSSLYNQRQLPL